ncbi:MAG: hypothetical protein GIW97_00710 [Candidatus Eremiobacteraeota bacterium]|nr:hypothetical protein [Candidatus Eremiobacteraeota bacterium]
MKPFDYLTVLISIIMGLAIANLLSGAVRLMHARHRLRLYWPTIVWSILLFIVTAQHWWAEFSLHTKLDWTFGGFLATLIIPVDLYLLCALALPNDDDATDIDLRAWYFKNRRTFFVLLIILAPLSYLEELLTTGSVHKAPLETVLLGTMAAVLILGLVSRRPRIHAGIALVFSALLVTYVAILFNRLPGH